MLILIYLNTALYVFIKLKINKNTCIFRFTEIINLRINRALYILYLRIGSCI